ncbi:MAG: hypothetical protein Q7V01_02445, partial [Vicinamibacterales bacterium]|nr:hypothetical protein [Vicinamibacterales bacterium]
MAVAAYAAVAGASSCVESSMAAQVQAQAPRPAAPAAVPAEPDDQEFLRAAERLIAHGQRAEAARLATARGAAGQAGSAILARLDADAGRL